MIRNFVFGIVFILVLVSCSDLRPRNFITYTCGGEKYGIAFFSSDNSQAIISFGSFEKLPLKITISSDRTQAHYGFYLGEREVEIVELFVEKPLANGNYFGDGFGSEAAYLNFKDSNEEAIPCEGILKLSS